MNETIVCRSLGKQYRVFERRPGLLGIAADLFRRDGRTVAALADFDLSVGAGEIVGLIGRNGAGKTTFMKLATGILTPSDGTIRVLGEEPARKRRAFLRRIAFVSGQKSQLWWDLPAHDTLLLLKEIYGVPTGLFRERLGYLTDCLGVEQKLHTPVRLLSLGERMKLEVVAALLHAPAVMFLDEPTIGLDLVSQERIRTFLRDANGKLATTIVLTSHNPSDLEDLASRIVVIEQGRKVFDASTAQFKDAARGGKGTFAEAMHAVLMGSHAHT